MSECYPDQKYVCKDTSPITLGLGDQTIVSGCFWGVALVQTLHAHRQSSPDFSIGSRLSQPAGDKLGTRSHG